MGIKEAYKVMQAAWVKEYDVRVGDTVKVLRIAKSHETGWDNNWPSDRFVDKTGKVADIRTTGSGVQIGGDCDNFLFPFFCLEKVKSAPHTIAFDGQESVEISDKSYKALKEALN